MRKHKWVNKYGSFLWLLSFSFLTVISDIFLMYNCSQMTETQVCIKLSSKLLMENYQSKQRSTLKVRLEIHSFSMSCIKIEIVWEPFKRFWHECPQNSLGLVFYFELKGRGFKPWAGCCVLWCFNVEKWPVSCKGKEGVELMGEWLASFIQLKYFLEGHCIVVDTPYMWS